MRWLREIEWSKVLSSDNAIAAIRVAAIVIVGWIFFRIVAALFGRMLRKRLSEQSNMLMRKAIHYTGWVVVLFLALTELGFNLTALLGAAGIAGIAIGFASQTSVSNIISGLFLISERPFAVGDVIKVGDVSGIVLSIDLMATKIRTFDNKFVRIPNEDIIKSQVTNITRFPIRRLDLNVGVAYKEDVDRVQRILMDIAKRNPDVLDEPEPVFIFKAFGDSALEILFGVWFAKADWIKVNNSMMRQIKERFDAEGIEIPFPHRTIYTGEVTAPFPIRIVGGEAAQVAPSESS